MSGFERYGEKTAIADCAGECSYSELNEMSLRAAGALQNICGGQDMAEARVAFMLPKSREYAAIKTAVWRAGGVSVPLSPEHPPGEIRHVTSDSEPSVIVCHPGFADKIRPQSANAVFVRSDEIFSSPPSRNLPEISPSRRAMMIYTSGTTGEAKGVITTHSNIAAQTAAMTAAWKWTASDRVLNVLPLHHLHGILNLLLCPLSAGAVCEMADLEPSGVWERFERGGITVFMAVPTVYSKLADFWENAPEERKKSMTAACRAMRLMVSGSAALTVKLSERWRGISGHTLLERYGMTETGMILSNPLEGKRKPGFVGKPMPGVFAGVFSPSGEPLEAGESGEIRVKGENVFLEYWNNPAETKRAFSDGMFKTGDIARIDGEGDFQILGRESVDIIKTGGYKVSALEVEREIAEKTGVVRCAVVGVRDEEWGQRVAAAVVLEDGRLAEGDLKKWLKPRLASYKIPSLVKVVPSLPENSLGKVLKTEIAAMWEDG
ncbi:MAG: acyl-CoA synthetase [Thermodesulfobacteriota bacterium]